MPDLAVDNLEEVRRRPTVADGALSVVGVGASLAELARHFTEVKRARAALARQDRELLNAEGKLEGELSERFADSGLHSVVLADGANVHLIEQSWPELIVAEGADETDTKIEAVNCLLALGERRAVNYNQQALRSRLLELADDDGSIPEPLGRFFRVKKVIRVGVSGK